MEFSTLAQVQTMGFFPRSSPEHNPIALHHTAETNVEMEEKKDSKHFTEISYIELPKMKTSTPNLLVNVSHLHR